MLNHRFQDYWAHTDSDAVLTEFTAAPAVPFVPCPCPVMQTMTYVQQLQTEQLYRLAYEQAQAQVRRANRSRVFDFSEN